MKKGEQITQGVRARELTTAELRALGDCVIGHVDKGPTAGVQQTRVRTLYVFGLVEWSLNHGRFVPTKQGLVVFKRGHFLDK